MFAILLSKEMNPFYLNISSFPTVIFSFVLAICVLFWLIAVLGVIDIDFLGVETSEGTVNAMAGLLLKFGLHGIPLTVIISLWSLFGWILSYYAVYYLSGWVPQGILLFIFNGVVFITALFFSILLTVICLHFIRPIFPNNEQKSVKKLIGKTAIVRTSKVTELFGEVFLEDGGAGLILKVRTDKDKPFIKGDKVVLLEYFEESNTYYVVSEHTFYS